MVEGTITRRFGRNNGHSTQIDIKFENCKITITKKIKFIKNPAGADDSAFSKFKQNFKDAISRFMNNSFKLIMTGDDCPCREIPIEIKLVEDNNGYPLNMMVGSSDSSPSGTNGARIQENDRTGTPDIANANTYAHEAGHFILGANDEYRGNNTNAPVFNDNSLMGNYHQEGYQEAEIKARHFQFVKDWFEGHFPPANNCPVTLVKIGPKKEITVPIRDLRAAIEDLPETPVGNGTCQLVKERDTPGGGFAVKCKGKCAQYRCVSSPTMTLQGTNVTLRCKCSQ